jgi:tetratricopeptide (TPR) repeat protein
MKERLPFVIALIVALAAGCALADDTDQSTAAPAGDPDGSVALAENFSTLAHQTFRSKKIPAKALELDAALYRAACKLDPTEPRFARALADVLLQLNDVPGATVALKSYMALDPSDQTAQVQYIDLCLASPQMQSLDQRLTYLRYLLKKRMIPDPVKSEIAFRAAQLLNARGQSEEAKKLLDSARVLNPVNLKVLRIRYIMTQDKALPVDRVHQLLDIMQANPCDPVVASRLAEQLAQLALVDSSITWYGLANKLYSLSSTAADPAFVLGASSELLIGKRAEEAANLASRYTQVRPEDADGWFVLLSIVKFQLSLFQDEQMHDLQTATLRKAANSLANRIIVIRKMTGDTEATTRPIDSPTETTIPDLSDDADRFKANQYHGLAMPYDGSLASLAWLHLYYEHDSKAAAPLIDDLARLVPANDDVLQRLKGWQKFVDGDTKGALAILKPIAANDPLAGLGVVLIEAADPTKKAVFIRDAQKLLNAHPSGVVGAVLWAEFSPYHLSVQASPDSGTVATLVSNVPQTFLQLVSEPRTVYAVQISPLKGVYRYGDPITVRVLLQNISTVNLAVGEDSAIHPELWFDAHMRGMVNQTIPGAAVGRLDQKLVLAPGDTVMTTLRIDQDSLRDLVQNNPNLELIANLVLILNPTLSAPGPNGQPPQTMPGACGYAQDATQLIDREPTPIDTPDQRLAVYQGLNSDDGGEKIRSMSVIAAYLHFLKAHNVQNADAVVAELSGKLHRVDNGGKECVLAFQKYLLAGIASGDDQTNILSAMANDEHWQTRMLALQIAHQLGQKGRAIADQLSNSKDPIVRDYAIALSQSLAAASTQPSDAAASPQPGDSTAPPAQPADSSSLVPQEAAPAPSPQTSQTP